MKVRNIKNRYFKPAAPTLQATMQKEWEKNVERIRTFNKRMGFPLFSEDTYIPQAELDFYETYNVSTSAPFYVEKLAA